ncbi:MAG: hypothetical protein ACYTBJ_00785 [Planctomycetota bacterium]|jgi:hypothetical protein
MAYKYKTNAKRQHEKAAASGNRFKPVVCKKRMFGKPCEHCNKVAKLSQSEDEDDKKIAGKCRAKSTYYMNIVDMLGKKKNQIYGSGIENWRELIENLPDEDGEGVDFTDPDKAYAVLLKRTGKGLGTSYNLKISNKSLVIPAKYLKGMYQLHDIVNILEKGDEELIWTPAQGKNKFLVLPPWGKEADGDFFKEVFYHWNTDLLGATEEDDEFGEDGGDEDFGDDAGDEDFSDDFDDGDDAPADDDDDFGADDDGDADTDDFEDTDDAEEAPDLDAMDKKALIKLAGLKGIKLSDKAKAASADKLRPYLKKKLEDVPW